MTCPGIHHLKMVADREPAKARLIAPSPWSGYTAPLAGKGVTEQGELRPARPARAVEVGDSSRGTMATAFAPVLDRDGHGLQGPVDGSGPAWAARET
jgi:hypothetical protein